MLSGRVAENYGHAGLPEDTITLNVSGTAGQSFGAWVTKGVTIKLSGEGNDYVGKGLSGGKIIINPPADCKIENHQDNIIVGKHVLYGAISGEAYFNGSGGERFCVRNSGATAALVIMVVNTMTGGIVACLGKTGRNFAAGMSGGIAYVFDENDDFARRCNTEMVELENLKPDGAKVDTADLLQADETRLKQLIRESSEIYWF
ncbi:Glutamate synthase 2 [NADH], chloroplastic [Nymphon striatum]|nr:Glutamate synthase 2 [NADH], chloroplastic [Nymphon striatum]